MLDRFTEDNLTDGERILHRSLVHWLIFFISIFWYCVAIGSFFYHPYLGLLVAIFASYEMGKAAVYKYFTEMIVTNKRAIVKVGFISRQTIEITLSKIESVQIHQSILDRVLGTGTVAIRGTGSGIAPVKFIDNPVEFRNEINAAMAEYKKD